MKVRRIDFSADEWLSGTAELSPYDRGVYITICALIYSRGKRVRVEVVASHCGVHGNALNASLARLENARKIVRNGLEIGQKRSENELEKAQKRAEKWSENLPNAKKTNGVDEPPARARSARVTRNHQPSTKETSSDVSPPPLSPPASGRGKKRLSPVEGIAKGFADALADIAARDGRADHPSAGALLDGSGAGSVTPLNCRRLA